MSSRYPLLLPLLYCITSIGYADIQFEFDYSFSAEFSDPVDGPVRQASLEAAAASLGAYFNHDATLQVFITSSNDPQSGLLASAGSPSVPASGNFSGFLGSVAERKVLSGTDENGSQPDIFVDVNFGVPWDFDDNVDSGTFDFKSTIIHELVHGLGFSSCILEDGQDYSGTLPGNPGRWNPFDQYLTDSAEVPLIDGTYALDGSRWNALSVGGGDGLFFSGPLAVAANGGEPVSLYTPTSWEQGSSVSHLDDQYGPFAGMLMLATAGTGQQNRNLSPVELGILSDLGYALTVPILASEPMMSIVKVDGEYVILLEANSGIYEIQESFDLVSWTSSDLIFLNEPYSQLISLDPTRAFYRAVKMQGFEAQARVRAPQNGPKWRR